MTDPLADARAAVESEARGFIATCMTQPCEGCDFEVEQVMALADAYALEAFGLGADAEGCASALSLLRMPPCVHFCGERKCVVALRARLGGEKGEGDGRR